MFFVAQLGCVVRIVMGVGAVLKFDCFVLGSNGI